jgi:hypothetical protein
MVFKLPFSLKELVVKEIQVHSQDLVACLPTSVGSLAQTQFSPPSSSGTVADTAPGQPDALTSTLEEAQLVAIRARHSDYWFNLQTFSNSTLQPLVESLLRARFANLERLEAKAIVNWSVSHVPLLSGNLESVLINVTAKSPVISAPDAPQPPTSEKKSQAAASSSALFKTFCASMPPSLTQLYFSIPIPHWGPRQLPKTLTLLACDASQFNVDSYCDMPRALTALRLTNVEKFFAKHALGLPTGLQVLDIQCPTLKEEVFGHLPQTLTALRRTSSSQQALWLGHQNLAVLGSLGRTQIVEHLSAHHKSELKPLLSPEDLQHRG